MNFSQNSQTYPYLRDFSPKGHTKPLKRNNHAVVDIAVPLEDYEPVYPRNFTDILVEDLYSKTQILRLTSNKVTVRELINLISDTYWVAPHHLRITLGSIELANFMTMSLKDIGLEHQNIIRLKLRLRGGKELNRSSLLSPLLYSQTPLGGQNENYNFVSPLEINFDPVPEFEDVHICNFKSTPENEARFSMDNSKTSSILLELYVDETEHEEEGKKK